MNALYEGCRRIVDTTAFLVAVSLAILLNAVLLGVETYEPGGGADDAIGVLDKVFVAIFLCELAIRIVSYGPRPWRFFGEGWNVFDFVIIMAVFIPGVGQNTTLLRLLRLLRVTRLLRLFPDMRLLVRAVVRSVPKVASLVLLTVLMLYVYGIVGWLIFEDDYPDRWGNIGEAMLSLFTTMTLENFPEMLEQGRAVSDWTIAYFVSFAVLAAFILFNLLIGIVISSLEEARSLVAEEELEAGLGHAPSRAERDRAVHDRVGALRRALHELESELAARERAG